MSVRIFGSGGGVITDATATPEDVVSGQVFYNNDGRQTGTNEIKRTQKQIYVCEKGEHSSMTAGTCKFISNAYTEACMRSNPRRHFIINFSQFPNVAGTSTPIMPPTSGNTNRLNEFYSISNLNIPISSIDHIQIGSCKLIIGSNSCNGVFVYYINIGDVQWIYNNSPVSNKDESVYPLLEYKLSDNTYYLKSIGLVNSVYNWNSRYSTSVYTTNIPIAINTYID